MAKFNFLNDYHDGGHPRILTALGDHALHSSATYGEDVYSEEARALILKEIGKEEAGIHFVTGGTQANIITLSAMMRPYESVIAAESAHIHVHETGAVEAAGHKINAVPTADGKLTPAHIEEVLIFHQDEHQVRPRVVFISQSTELGTLYSHHEMKELSSFCRKKHLLLYADGARLGSALTAEANDMTMAELASLADVFYIGGTKNGALAAEAIVICRPEIQENFRYIMKQKGGLLAKGRFLGIQFAELFRDGLYYELADKANQKAARLREGISMVGYTFQTPSLTNQIFPVFPDLLIRRLQADFDFYVWQKMENQSSSIRLVTSWNTPDAAIDRFLKTVNAFSKTKIF